MSANRQHRYRVELEWTGNRGPGTTGYRDYDRGYELRAVGKPTLAGSADPAFRGDATRWNPEELLVAALSACHELWYLHLCADAGVVVTAYRDRAEGVMEQTADGAGHFTRVTLYPRVEIRADGDAALALELHEGAHARCFIARSVAFEVTHEPTITPAATAG